MGRGVLGAALVAAVMALAPAGAQARDGSVTSADGTNIVFSFFPAPGLKAGQRAPTVLVGHGFGQSRDGATTTSNEQVGSIGVAPLLKAGFNVLTWDARGFGMSGGFVSVDGPLTEGRDVQALIDYVAKQPEAQLDRPGDPRLGMAGASYGGGIQLVTAGIDPRVDAIVPDIAWHSLQTSLYKDDDFKFGWNNALVGAGLPAAQMYGDGFDPHITSAFSQGEATGKISQDNLDWFISRGPGDDLVGKIRAPTLLTQGTADTLFTLREARENFAQLAGNHVPVKMIWFCGGHGICETTPGPKGQLESAAIGWFDRFLKGEDSVDLGPGFTWDDQEGTVHQAATYPPPQGPPLVADGAPGSLALSAGDTSGQAVAAGPAPGAAQIAVPAPSTDAQLVGEPQLSLTYNGTASPTGSYAYAQLVDTKSNLVVGNVTTPIPLVLDGATHTIDRPMEGIAYHATPATRLTLQLAGGTSVFSPQRSTGAVTFSKAHLTIPTVDTAKAAAEVRSGASSATPPGSERPVGGPGSTPPLVRIAILGSRASHRGARQLRLRVSTNHRLTTLRITLSRGGRRVARRTLHGVGDRTALTLRLSSRLRHGSYRLEASYVTAQDVHDHVRRTRTLG